MNAKKIGFIDYYLDEWHSNNYPKMISEQSGGRYEVALAYAEVPSPRPGGRTNEKWSADMNIPLETSMDELIEKSDVLIVLSPDNPEQHLRLSEAALKSGKRTYIDKTFAPDAETARAIFDIADKYGTPCWSSSALRFADVYKDVPKAISRLQAFGGGEFKMYLIHQLEPIVKLMGCDIKRVMSVGNDKFPSILIEFKDGRTAETNQYNGADFSMKLGYCDGSYSELKVGGEFWTRCIDSLIEFFDTGRVIVPHEETIAIAAVRAAAIKAAAQPYEWVGVEV